MTKSGIEKLKTSRFVGNATMRSKLKFAQLESGNVFEDQHSRVLLCMNVHTFLKHQPYLFGCGSYDVHCKPLDWKDTEYSQTNTM